MCVIIHLTWSLILYCTMITLHLENFLFPELTIKQSFSYTMLSCWTKIQNTTNKSIKDASWAEIMIRHNHTVPNCYSDSKQMFHYKWNGLPLQPNCKNYTLSWNQCLSIHPILLSYCDPNATTFSLSTDVSFGPEESTSPLESALIMLEVINQKASIPQQDFENVCTLIKEMVCFDFIYFFNTFFM